MCAGADEIQIGVLAELRQRRDQELGALAAAHAPGHEKARLRMCRPCVGPRRFVRPRREAVRDHVTRKFGKLGRKTKMISERGAARRDQRRAGAA
jgi:hypothetical protein